VLRREVAGAAVDGMLLVVGDHFLYMSERPQVSQNGYVLSRRGRSLPANASGFEVAVLTAGEVAVGRTGGGWPPARPWVAPGVRGQRHPEAAGRREGRGQRRGGGGGGAPTAVAVAVVLCGVRARGSSSSIPMRRWLGD
jgi:hypothetical protein